MELFCKPYICESVDRSKHWIYLACIEV